jgi:molecular chaperone GrpE (heat shock protein)
MIASVVWSKLGLTCIPHSTTKGKHMTQQEVMEALDKAGIDYEFIEEFDGSMHIIVKFEEEKND